MARSLVKLEGFAELEAKLKELPQNIAKRASMTAMRRAATVMADQIRDNIPQGRTGNLRNSIVIKARSRNLTGLTDYAAVMRDGGSFRDASAALRAARAGGSDGTRILVTVASTAPHAHLVEFGTVERFWKTDSGKSTGVMPMHPYMRPAWDEKSPECLQIIKQELLVEIRKAEAKAGKRA